MIKLNLTPDVFQETKAWLLSREDDIAWGMEDLGQMKGFFKALIGREPKKRVRGPSVDDLDNVLLENMC